MNNPFLVSKVSLYLTHFSAGGIRKDPVLKRDLDDFLSNDYPQVLGRMVNNNKAVETISKKWWPGDDEVVANYDPTQKTKWLALNSRLNDYIKQQIDKLGLAGNFANLFLDYTAIKIKLLYDIEKIFRYEAVLFVVVSDSYLKGFMNRLSRIAPEFCASAFIFCSLKMLEQGECFYQGRSRSIKEAVSQLKAERKNGKGV